ncbi:ParB/RepB/Spo0J family partition protein [Scandinavium goeteborgense]|uniref:Uncharacterized protein YubM n=1 Tax=Scandinavium goeteborgense TaxID=1851514 RepID=A0A4R6E2H3_SCAGO|nr:ParB/RepB/Spo0J family partition protein [Scandinavium goeteborgense]TDN51514.1 ParB family chromosome partitioning protein [Scandinavium goeteborgense]
MSDTNTTAKAAKKSTAAKVSKADAAALKAALEAAQIQMVPLSALVKSPLNIRTVPYSDSSVRELADTIAAVGLLQNLVVHSLDDGGFGVAAGGRRLAAMQMLASEGKYLAEQAVAVKVIPASLAVVASLTENAQRVDMHPAEQIVGFRRLSESGKTPAQIGDALGFGFRHVQRMLKLAGLEPSVLEALAKDELTTEHCHALALESDPARQAEVLETARKSAWNGVPTVQGIRNLIIESDVSTTNPMFDFVGEAAFSDTDIRRDLFSENEGGYVDRVLLETKVMERLAEAAADIQRDEGWAWCQGQITKVKHYGEDRLRYTLMDKPDPVYLDGEALRLDALTVEYDSFDSHCDRTGEIELEITRIELAAEARAWTVEQKAGSGVVVSYDCGCLHIQRGVVLKTEEEAEQEEARVAAMTHVREPEPVDEISLPLLKKMSSERTLAVQATLMQQPQKAVALMAWTMCTHVFCYCHTTTHPFGLRVNVAHSSLVSNAPSGENGTAYVALMAEKSRLEALLPQGWAKDFTTFFTLDGQLLMSLMAYCTACSVNGVQGRECGHTSRSPLDALETALDFHLRDWWQPTKANFFSSLSKTQITDALNEAGHKGAACDVEKMKKGDAAERAEDVMAAGRWVPAWLKAPEVSDSGQDVTDESHSDSDDFTAHAA